MALPTLREYPQLPILPMEHALKVLKLGNVGPTVAASLMGMSRVAVNRWYLAGAKNPNRSSQDAVSTLAYKVLRALKHKHFPLQKDKRATAASLEALYDRCYEKPLSATAPQELLPKAWLDQLNLPRDQHEPESVL